MFSSIFWAYKFDVYTITTGKYYISSVNPGDGQQARIQDFWLVGARTENNFWGNKKVKISEFPISIPPPLWILEGHESGFVRKKTKSGSKM